MITGTSRYDYRCTHCRLITEVRAPFAKAPREKPCGNCGHPMHRYFGRTEGEDLPISYGYREARYPNKTDAEIAKFQFQNL